VRKEKKSEFLLLLFLGILGFLIWFLSVKLLYPPYLTFSDAAKFADAAFQMIQGNGFTAKFGFFHPNFVFSPESSQPIAPGFGILNAISIFIFFKILGVNDFAVIFSSGFFFILTSFLIYFLAKKLFNQKIAFFSALSFIFTQPLLNYASIGASEPLFVFLFLLSCFLFIQKGTYSVYASGIVGSLLFLTRPQAPIYFVGLTLLVFLCAQKNKIRRLLVWTGVFILIIVSLFILSKLTGQKLIHLELAPSLFSERATVSQNITIRGKPNVFYSSLLSSFKPLATKAFYNLYNFYKLLPSLASFSLITLYFLSLIRWDRKKEANALHFAGFFILLVSFFVSAITIPFMRYIHPVVPLVIIFSVEMLFWILDRIFKDRKKVLVVCTLFILFFVIGQTLGSLFLDSRYLRNHVNWGKPPAYVKLAQILRENTKENEIVLSNLDTWGTWYGKRKTIWFPSEPEQLVPPQNKRLAIDAIYLTSYKMDDEASFMGDGWRKILNFPEQLEDDFISRNFNLVKKFEISENETYEGEKLTAVLLTRNKK